MSSYVFISSIFRSRMLCDVILVADNVEIHAHRAILAACSPYFYAMFTGELTESKQETITLQVMYCSGLRLT